MKLDFFETIYNSWINELKTRVAYWDGHKEHSWGSAEHNQKDILGWAAELRIPIHTTRVEPVTLSTAEVKHPDTFIKSRVQAIGLKR